MMCEQEITFSLFYCHVANHCGYPCTTHAQYVLTYLVATKGLPYLPTYIGTYLQTQLLTYLDGYLGSVRSK
jgi:hypothetical protein